VSGRRGRRHNPICGYGPAADFARLLREALVAAGTPSRVELAKKGLYAPSTMSIIDSGRTMPTWPQVEAYLRGCDITGPALDTWRARHAEHTARAEVFRPDLAGVADVEALRVLLLATIRASGASLPLCARRARDGRPDFLPEPVPDGRTLLAAAESGGLTEPAVVWLVYTAGGAHDDVAAWVSRYRELPAAPPGDASSPDGGPLSDSSAGGGTADPGSREDADGSREAADGSREDADGARETAAPPSRRWRRRALLGGLAAAILVPFGVKGAGALWDGASDNRTTPEPASGSGAASNGTASNGVSGRSAAGSPPPPLEPRVDGAAAAGPALLELAGRAERVAAAPIGRYRCVHRTAWTVETTEAAAPEVCTDERLCWANDARGRRVVTVSRRGAVPETKTEDLPPGPPPGAVDPPDADPARLAEAALRQRPKPDGHVRPLLLCVDLADTYPLAPPQRAAALRMLAAQDGIVPRGQGVDRLGRNGLAFSADGADGRRVTLLFDPADGRLLGAQVDVPVPSAAGAVNRDDIAYVEAGWSDRLA
jgi:hypothetical protein